MNSSPLPPPQACLESSTARTRRAASRPSLGRLLAFALVATFGVYGLSNPGQSQTAPAKAAPTKEAPAKEVLVKEAVNLEGSWSGGGSVSFAVTGAKEQARCRAHYSRRSKDSYAVKATCATASGKAAQVATVHKVGENRYRGNFHNPDFDISGTIFVVVNGNTQNVRLSSSSGWAIFKLSR